jgi:hypothetical protein
MDYKDIYKNELQKQELEYYNELYLKLGKKKEKVNID